MNAQYMKNVWFVEQILDIIPIYLGIGIKKLLMINKKLYLNSDEFAEL